METRGGFGRVVKDNGDTVIAPSLRPDGSMRKERRVRSGYIPQEEIPLYRAPRGSLPSEEDKKSPMTHPSAWLPLRQSQTQAPPRRVSPPFTARPRAHSYLPEEDLISKMGGLKVGKASGGASVLRSIQVSVSETGQRRVGSVSSACESSHQPPLPPKSWQREQKDAKLDAHALAMRTRIENRQLSAAAAPFEKPTFGRAAPMSQSEARAGSVFGQPRPAPNGPTPRQLAMRRQELAKAAAGGPRYQPRSTNMAQIGQRRSPIMLAEGRIETRSSPPTIGQTLKQIPTDTLIDVASRPPTPVSCSPPSVLAALPSPRPSSPSWQPSWGRESPLSRPPSQSQRSAGGSSKPSSPSHRLFDPDCEISGFRSPSKDLGEKTLLALRPRRPSSVCSNGSVFLTETENEEIKFPSPPPPTPTFFISKPVEGLENHVCAAFGVQPAAGLSTTQDSALTDSTLLESTGTLSVTVEDTQPTPPTPSPSSLPRLSPLHLAYSNQDLIDIISSFGV